MSGTTYWRAKDGSDEMATLFEVMQEHHQHLMSAGVSIALVFAEPPRDENGDPKRPGVMHSGYPAAAVTKRTSLKQRALGLPDAEITFDAAWWENHTQAEIEAVVDHELTHLDLVYDDNKVELDDLGRPKLQLRRHDYQFGWFSGVVQRHGKRSVEHQQAKQFMDEAGQLFFDLEGVGG